jgi:integrase/recombinase XerD
MLLRAWLAITTQWSGVFRRRRTVLRAQRQALGSLLCPGRSTLSRIIRTTGREQNNWSPEYFLHSRAAWSPHARLEPMVGEGLQYGPGRPTAVAVHVPWCGQVRLVPFKKTSQPHIHYLDKPEVDALLSTAKGDSVQARKDYALILLRYNSRTRVSEAVHLTIGDFEIRHPSGSLQHVVKIFGKGSKTRYCPLWPATAAALAVITAGRQPEARVFLNRLGQPLTRSGVYALVDRYGQRAAAKQPSLKNKKVTPHVIRHTTACHLLKAGVDLNTIRAWLGHVSLDTTNIYAEIDVEMKSKALAKCEISGDGNRKRWRDDADLMAFLKSL